MVKLDKVKYLKRVIIVAWIALGLCFAIKLFGGNLFEIVCNNTNFIAICEYCDNNLWAGYLICSLYSLTSMIFFIMIILQRYTLKKWEIIVFVSTTLVGVGIKIWNPNIGFIFDIWQAVIMPMVFLGKNYKAYLRILIANILVMVFQLISMFVKDASFNEIYENSVVGAIFAIDVIIMTVLYMLYSIMGKNKKEVTRNE